MRPLPLTYRTASYLVEVLLYAHRNRRFIRDGSQGRPPRHSHSSELWDSSMLLYVHRNRRFIRDGSQGRPPRLSHSSWTLRVTWLVGVLLYVHRNRRLIRDGHLDFHTAPELAVANQSSFFVFLWLRVSGLYTVRIVSLPEKKATELLLLLLFLLLLLLLFVCLFLMVMYWKRISGV